MEFPEGMTCPAQFLITLLAWYLLNKNMLEKSVNDRASQGSSNDSPLHDPGRPPKNRPSYEGSETTTGMDA